MPPLYRGAVVRLQTKGVKRQPAYPQSYKLLEKSTATLSITYWEGAIHPLHQPDDTAKKALDIPERGEAFKAPEDTNCEDTKDERKKTERGSFVEDPTQLFHYVSLLKFAALRHIPAFRAVTTVLLYHSLKDEVDTRIYPEVEPRKADTASGSCR